MTPASPAVKQRAGVRALDRQRRRGRDVQLRLGHDPNLRLPSTRRSWRCWFVEKSFRRRIDQVDSRIISDADSQVVPFIIRASTKLRKVKKIICEKRNKSQTFTKVYYDNMFVDAIMKREKESLFSHLETKLKGSLCYWFHLPHCSATKVYSSKMQCNAFVEKVAYCVFY